MMGFSFARSLGFTSALVRPPQSGGGGSDAPTPLPPPNYVFGASSLSTVAYGDTATLYSPVGSRLNETADVYHPPMPAGTRVIFHNFGLKSDTIVEGAGRELLPGNSNKIDFSSLFTGPNGSGTRIPLSFGSEIGVVMANGGFAFSDPIPHAFPGGFIRTSITTPSGGKRPGGWNAQTGRGEVRGVRGAPNMALATSGSVANGTPDSNRGYQPIGILVPGASVPVSLIQLADSIYRQDDIVPSPRGALGAVARGLDDEAGGGTFGLGNFGHAGASMIDFMDITPGSLKFSLRYALLSYIKDTFNDGRWPFSAIWSQGLRNDFSGIATPTTADEALPLLKARAQSWWNFLNTIFPGVPIIQSTISARVTDDATTGYTTLTGQWPRQYTAGPALEMFNDWLMTKPAPLFLAVDFRPQQQEMKDTQYGIAPVWKRTPLTMAGGATLAAPLVAGTLYQTINVNAPVPPEVGTYAIFEPATNIERRGTIYTVVDNGGGSYTVGFGSGFTPTKAHPAGSVMMTAPTSDGTHPGGYVMRLWAGAVVAVKHKVKALVDMTGVVIPVPTPDPEIVVSSGPGYAGSEYTVTNGDVGNWQANGSDIAGQTSAKLLMTTALEGSVIRWRRNDGKASNTVQMRRPQDIAGLVALFDIRQGLSVTASAVSAWQSQVGGVVGTQAVGSRQPVFGETAFAGAPGLNFVSQQAFEGVAINTGPEARTYIGGLIFAASFGVSFLEASANNNYLLRRIASRVLQIVRKNIAVVANSTVAIAENVPIIFVAAHGDGGWGMRSNGVDIGSGALANPGFTSGGTQTISALSGGMNGVITSQAIYDARLSGDNIAFVEGWIAHTLGKVDLLGEAHPFKSAASMRVTS